MYPLTLCIVFSFSFFVPAAVQVATAKLDTLDSWDISIHLPHSGLKSPLPHCLTYMDLDKSEAAAKHSVTAKGMFWNYLSVSGDYLIPILPSMRN